MAYLWSEAVTKRGELLVVDGEDFETTPSSQTTANALVVAARTVFERVQYTYDSVAFTTAATNVFNMSAGSAVFGAKMTRVTDVWVAGKRLYRLDGSFGLLSWSEFVELYPEWRDADTSDSQVHAAVSPQGRLVFGKKFSTVGLSNCYVAGRGYPNTPNMGGADASAEWPVPERLEWAVLYEAAMHAMTPTVDSVKSARDRYELYRQKRDEIELAFSNWSAEIDGPFSGVSAFASGEETVWL